MIFLIILFALNVTNCINAAEITKFENVKVQPLSSVTSSVKPLWISPSTASSVKSLGTLSTVSSSVNPLATSSYVAPDVKPQGSYPSSLNVKTLATSSPVIISIKPLAISSSSTPSLSTTTENILTSKDQIQPNKSLIKMIKPTQSTQEIKNNSSYDIDYEELDKLFEKLNKPRNLQKLSNKELLDKIFQMILKNKHVDIDCGSYHCLSGPHDQRNKNQKEKKYLKPYGLFQEPVTDDFYNIMALAKKFLFNDQNYNFDQHIMQPMKTPSNGMEGLPFITINPRNRRIWLE